MLLHTGCRRYLFWRVETEHNNPLDCQPVSRHMLATQQPVDLIFPEWQQASLCFWRCVFVFRRGSAKHQMASQWDPSSISIVTYHWLKQCHLQCKRLSEDEFSMSDECPLDAIASQQVEVCCFHTVSLPCFQPTTSLLCYQSNLLILRLHWDTAMALHTRASRAQQLCSGVLR